jgi:hypothetical protein
MYGAPIIDVVSTRDMKSHDSVYRDLKTVIGPKSQGILLTTQYHTRYTMWIP